MNIVSRQRLEEFKRDHADAAGSLDAWYAVVALEEWSSFVDVRNTFGSASYVEEKVVFNLKGNSYRLITTIDYPSKMVFLRSFLTHAEYDRGRWK